MRQRGHDGVGSWQQRPSGLEVQPAWHQRVPASLVLLVQATAPTEYLLLPGYSHYCSAGPFDMHAASSRKRLAGRGQEAGQAP